MIKQQRAVNAEMIVNLKILSDTSATRLRRDRTTDGRSFIPLSALAPSSGLGDVCYSAALLVDALRYRTR